MTISLRQISTFPDRSSTGRRIRSLPASGLLYLISPTNIQSTGSPNTYAIRRQIHRSTGRRWTRIFLSYSPVVAQDCPRYKSTGWVKPLSLKFPVEILNLPAFPPCLVYSLPAASFRGRNRPSLIYTSTGQPPRLSNFSMVDPLPVHA